MSAPLNPEDHVGWDALAVGWALSALDPEDEARFAVHLPGCARCTGTVREALHTVGDLAYALPDEAPPPALKARLMAAVAAEPRRPGAAVEPPSPVGPSPVESSPVRPSAVGSSPVQPSAVPPPSVEPPAQELPPRRPGRGTPPPDPSVDWFARPARPQPAADRFADAPLGPVPGSPAEGPPAGADRPDLGAGPADAGFAGAGAGPAGTGPADAEPADPGAVRDRPADAGGSGTGEPEDVPHRLTGSGGSPDDRADVRNRPAGGGGPVPPGRRGGPRSMAGRPADLFGPAAPGRPGDQRDVAGRPADLFGPAVSRGRGEQRRVVGRPVDLFGPAAPGRRPKDRGDVEDRPAGFGGAEDRAGVRDRPADLGGPAGPGDPRSLADRPADVPVVPGRPGSGLADRPTGVPGPPVPGDGRDEQGAAASDRREGDADPGSWRAAAIGAPPGTDPARARGRHAAPDEPDTPDPEVLVPPRRRRAARLVTAVAAVAAALALLAGLLGWSLQLRSDRDDLRAVVARRDAAIAELTANGPARVAALNAPAGGPTASRRATVVVRGSQVEVIVESLGATVGDQTYWLWTLRCDTSQPTDLRPVRGFTVTQSEFSVRDIGSDPGSATATCFAISQEVGTARPTAPTTVVAVGQPR